jgi:hypothetical protein
MAIRGVLLKRNSDLGSQDYTTYGSGVNYNDASSEVYDTDGFHSTASNQHLITIPSAVDGEYGIFTANLALADYTVGTRGLFMEIIRSGGDDLYVSTNATDSINGADTCTLSVCTGPILLSTGHTYQQGVWLTGGDTSVTVKAETNFGLFVLDNFSAAQVLCKKAADETGANYSTTGTIAWDGTDVYDTHGFHSPSSDNSQIIIPAALNNHYCQLRANVTTGSNASVNLDAGIAIRRTRGGTPSIVYDGVGMCTNRYPAFTTWTQHGIQCATQVIQVQTGDIFDVRYWNEDTSVDITAAKSGFSLICLGA